MSTNQIDALLTGFIGLVLAIGPGESEAAEDTAGDAPGRVAVGDKRLSAWEPFSKMASAQTDQPCCVGDECQMLDEAGCAELGGYWLAASQDCGGQPDCDLPGSDSPCCTGSCCIGSGECEDEIGGQPVDEPNCHTSFPGATFAGGALCNNDPAPCPACPIESTNNCLAADGTDVYLSDLSMWPSGRLADDIVATGTTISQICVRGSYIDSTLDCEVERCDCACADDDTENCIPQVDDDFTVTVYQDAVYPGTAPGESSLPGFVLASSTATAVRTLETQSADFDTWLTVLDLDEPITTLVPDEIYWIEVTNNTVWPDFTNTCDWYWRGNDAAGNDYSVHDSGSYWNVADMRTVDLGMCIDQTYQSPNAPQGACCLCDPVGDCVAEATLGECQNLGGYWRFAESCLDAKCLQSRPPGDDCLNDRQVFPTYGQYPISNVCATTDGPQDVCDTEMGADVWYEFVIPPCLAATCFLHLNMCPDDANFDAMLALYHDPENPTVCPPCPTDTQYEVACDNDGCGMEGGSPYIWQDCVRTGECYLIRFGGPKLSITGPCPEGCQGSGALRVEVGHIDYGPSEVPQGDPRTPDHGFGTKNRYLSFSVGDPGIEEVVQVTFVSLPGYEYAEGRTMWVQEPFPVTELSSSDGTTPDPIFMAAQLGCEPYRMDWSELGVIHVYDDAIVPGGTFEVRVNAHPCPLLEPDNLSDPLEVHLSGEGDVVGDCATCPCTAPDGVVDFVDISGVVDKFKNLVCVDGAGSGVPRKARVDLINTDIAQPLPDRKVDFVDISYVVEAFRGQAPPPPGPPLIDPCQ